MGRALRQRRRRRQLQLHRLRPGRQPGQSLRRPARRGSPTPPTAEGGALRSQDLRTRGDPTVARRHDHPRRPPDGTALGGQPADRQPRARTPAGSSPTACATRSASTSPTTARSGSATSAGTTGRRSTGSSLLAASPTSAGPATRAPAASPATTAPTSRSARRSTATAERRDRAVLRLQPQRQGRRRRELPDRRAPRSRACASTAARTSRRSYRDALFFADYSRDCIWAMRAGADGLPRPSHDRDLRRRRLEPGLARGRPRRRALLRRLRRRPDPADPVHGRRTRPPTAVADANPRTGPAPLTVQFDAPGSQRPGRRPAHLRLGPRRRRPVRRLDLADAQPHLRAGGTYVAARGHRRPRRPARRPR